MLKAEVVRDRSAMLKVEVVEAACDRSVMHGVGGALCW